MKKVILAEMVKKVTTGNQDQKVVKAALVIKVTRYVLDQVLLFCFNQKSVIPSP